MKAFEPLVFVLICGLTPSYSKDIFVPTWHKPRKCCGVWAAANICINERIYSCLLDGYVRNKDISMAEDVLARMIKANVKCNEITFNTLIHAYVVADKLEAAEQAMQRMAQFGVLRNTTTFNTIMSGYAALGDVKGAERVLQLMTTTPDKATWLPLFLEKAEAVLDRSDVPDLDGYAYNTLLSGFGNRGSDSGVQRVIDRMQAAGVPTGIVTLCARMTSHSRFGEIEQVEALFNEAKQALLEDRSSSLEVAYSILLQAYARQGLIGKAENLFAVMMALPGFTVDEYPFHSLLLMYADQGRVADCERILIRMRTKNISLSQRTFSCLLRAYGQLNNIDAIDDILENRSKEAKDERTVQIYEDVMRSCWSSVIHLITLKLKQFLGICSSHQSSRQQFLFIL